MPHCIQEGAPCPGVGTMTRTQAVPPQSWLPTGRAQEREKRSNLFVHCRFFLRSERPCSRGPRPRPSCHLSPVPTFPGWPLLPSMYSIDLSGFCKLTDADGRKNGAPLLVPSAQRASLCPISFLGRSDAGVMACRSSFLLLPPVLLVLLATGSRLLTADSVELQAVEGQTLTVRCSYTPETGPYPHPVLPRGPQPQLWSVLQRGPLASPSMDLSTEAQRITLDFSVSRCPRGKPR
nr:trem-like transcript 4 protein isoform X9 [Cavia porcellus]